METVLLSEKIQVQKLFNNLLISENQINEIRKEKFHMKLKQISNTCKMKYFYAEGNVSIFLPYGIFKADKISFDKKNRVLKVFKNINFKSGGQYFTASYLEYDFNSLERKYKRCLWNYRF